jgi:hypothetical protein
MVFLPNPPEADKSLRLPCEMRSLFLWGYAQKIILGISIICLWLFFSHALILNKNLNLWMDTTKPEYFMKIFESPFAYLSAYAVWRIRSRPAFSGAGVS